MILINDWTRISNKNKLIFKLKENLFILNLSINSKVELNKTQS